MSLFRNIGRFFKISGKGFYLWRKFSSLKPEEQRRSNIFPQELRKTFQELGPTFVKLGQMLSLRYDLLPKQYCAELQKLLDEVEPLPVTEVEKVIKDELGSRIDELFLKFDKRPVASASLGQVHAAILKNKEKVAVKIQRPDIYESIKQDIALLKKLTWILDKNPTLRGIDIPQVINEFEEWTMRELDYRIEARNAERFARNFKDFKFVKIPKIYRELTTTKVLTMEFIDALSLNDALKLMKKEGDLKVIKVGKAKIKAKTLVDLAAEIMFTMLVKHRFFHGDPHPANILINEKGQICLLDFGIVGYVSKPIIQLLGEAVIAMADDDIKAVVRTLVKLDQREGVGDIRRLERRLDRAIGEWKDSSISQFGATNFFTDILFEGSREGIDWPPDLVLVGKVIVTLDGLAQAFFPDFNIFQTFLPYFGATYRKDITDKFSEAKFARNLNSLASFATELPENMNKIINELKTGEIKVVQKSSPGAIDAQNLALKIKVLSGIFLITFIANIFLVLNSIEYRFLGIRLIDLTFFFDIGLFCFIIYTLLRKGS